MIGITPQIQVTRSATQKFDSIQNHVINDSDEYLDLIDLTGRFLMDFSDYGIQAAAMAVITTGHDYVILSKAESGDSQHYPVSMLDKNHVYGVSIFFPPGNWRRSFYNGRNLDFAADTVWGTLASQAFTLDEGVGWGPMLVDYIENITPSAPDNPNPPELASPGSVGSPITDATFSDVPTSYWAWQYIERLYNAGVTGGCSTTPLSYCPENSVTRAQMAIFLEKGVHYPAAFTPPNVSSTFSDTTGHWAEDWIEALRNDGITGGCGTNLYCPEDPVTRAQMAVFLLKSKYGSGYTPPAVGVSTGFSDVAVMHWAAPWIKQLAAEGITGGCGAGIYCPDSPVTRAQMAVFLVKTFNLP